MKFLIHYLHKFTWLYERSHSLFHVTCALLGVTALVFVDLERSAHVTEVAVSILVLLNLVCAVSIFLTWKLTAQLPRSLRDQPTKPLAKFLFRRVAQVRRNWRIPPCDEHDLIGITRLCHHLFEHLGLPLRYDQRERLYRQWWKANRCAFLPIKVQATLIGACIALPIRRKCANELVAGVRDVDSFDEDDIAPEGTGADCILFDMWAVLPEYRDENMWTSIKEMLRFIKLTMNATGASTILIQPDTDDMKVFIGKSGFQRIGNTSGGGELYAMNYLWSSQSI